ncbi:MAG: hydroxyacid dehydrogenase [Patescibacteria group bacterium]|nr:hydroxyacid dehydrogenase [Patescibacteria group bacterium]
MSDKIVFFEVEDWEKNIIQRSLGEYEIIFKKDKLSEDLVSEITDKTVISTFIYSSLNKGILEKLPNIKFIATRSTGFDHIDIAYCKEKSILVSNVPSYGEHTVAEHTFCLILALSRRLIPSLERTKRGDFSLDGLRGFDLYGKTIGVLGVGHIGKKVIEIAKGFGMNILAFTRHKDTIIPGVKFVPLEELIASSDVITIHVPATPETKHLINLDNINKFKKGSLLINTARGSIVETQAILEGLEAGILSGAGIDVLEEECFLKEERELLTSDFLNKCNIKTQLLNHVLLTKENVIITPHNAFDSKEALSQILEITVSNIKAFLEGKPENLVS